MEKPKAPGMKYRHYAPRAPVELVHDDVKEVMSQRRIAGQHVGILAGEEVCAEISEDPMVAKVPCGRHGDTLSFARELYAGLRAFDGEGPNAVHHPVDVILVVPPKNVTDGIGEAVMNRLRKAAAGNRESIKAK